VTHTEARNAYLAVAALLVTLALLVTVDGKAEVSVIPLLLALFDFAMAYCHHRKAQTS
jgi:hypothetical protein